MISGFPDPPNFSKGSCRNPRGIYANIFPDEFFERGFFGGFFVTLFRVFLNLWFGKPMVCVRVAFHENDGNHENDENDEDNSDSYKQALECWIRGNHGNHENDENHGNPWCKP